MRLIMKPFKFFASINNVDSKWLKQIQKNFAFHILNYLCNFFRFLAPISLNTVGDTFKVHKTKTKSPKLIPIVLYVQYSSYSYPQI